MKWVVRAVLFAAAAAGCASAEPDAPIVTGRVNEVMQLTFEGPEQAPTDHPTRDIDFWVLFRHESGAPEHRVYGFWDGDGEGGTTGSVFRVRFTPTEPGEWELVEVHGPDTGLHDQLEGEVVLAEPGDARGFWVPDSTSAGGRWFARSDGTRQYIVGNTHYDFLFAPLGTPATPETIRGDIDENAQHLNKLRFVVMSPREENTDPILHPFLDDSGQQTGQETGRPNPRFFRERVDVAVERAAEHDLIADLILAGTTGDQAATEEEFLKYMAARYGSYPNVWMTIGQEWDEQVGPEEQRRIGETLRRYLPYPTPLSTHARSGSWDSALNGDWNTHAIRQGKFTELGESADAIVEDYRLSDGKPVINDEAGYDPGESTTPDVMESMLGTFLGGGYGTTGHKTGSKTGGYFWGHRAVGETLAEHPSIPLLGFMKRAIEANLEFGRLSPAGAAEGTIFGGAPAGSRVLADAGRQYVLGTSAAASGVEARLPPGRWKVMQFDLLDTSEEVLASDAEGSFRFSTPASRAAMTLFINQDAPAETGTGLRKVDIAPVPQGDQALRVTTTDAELSQAAPADGDQPAAPCSAIHS